eukprot:6212645-Pleurochrysis_carterae.AAC.2
MVLCECGGYDRLVVETVGVGQSEVAVAGMVDMFILLLPPGAGDGLQGIKRGIMELADLVVVTKADGGLRAAAEAIAHDVDAALKVMRPRHSAWRPRVVTASSQDAEVAQKLLSVVDEFDEVSRKSGMRRERRRQQALASVFEHAKEEVFERLAAAPQVRRCAVEGWKGTDVGGSIGKRALMWAYALVDGRVWKVGCFGCGSWGCFGRERSGCSGCGRWGCSGRGRWGCSGRG